MSYAGGVDSGLKVLVRFSVTRFNEVDIEYNFLVMQDTSLENVKKHLLAALQANEKSFSGLHEQAYYLEEPKVTPHDTYLDTIEKIKACRSLADFNIKQPIDDGWSEDEESEIISNIAIEVKGAVVI